MCVRVVRYLTPGLVPPVIIAMLRNKDVCKQYDLSSLRIVFSGAAPLGDQTLRELREVYPQWIIGQGYGKRPLSWTSRHLFQN